MRIISVTLCLLCIQSCNATLPAECRNRGISFYSAQTTSNNKYRYTTIERGNYSIQALITFTGGDTCLKVTKDGLVKVYAIQYAIDKMNTKLSKFGAKLGLQLDDVCQSLPITMARGIEVVSLHRPNSVCRADFLKCSSSSTLERNDVVKATAIIGTELSFTAIPLASLMSLYSIPQVSNSASSRLLSKRELYKSFFRTIPSDTKQVLAMLDIIEAFKWNYIFAVGSDDDYGKLGVSDLKREAEKRNICIPFDEYIPYQSTRTDARVSEVVTKIKENAKAKVVVLFCYVDGLGDKIIQEAQLQGVERVWLTSEAWNPAVTTLLDPLQYRNQTEGLLAISLKTYPLPEFVDYMAEKVAKDVACNMWLQKFLEADFGCASTPFINTNQTDVGCGGKTVKVEDIMEKLKVLPGQVDTLINSAMALGLAIEKVLEGICKDGICNVDLKPEDVTNQMFNTSFKDALTGNQISFDNNGDPISAFYTIENLQIIDGKHRFVPVGNWTQAGDGGILSLDKDDIIWPSWWSNKTNGFPSSKCSEDCPPGTAVVGRSGCCWECRKCEGNNYTDTPMSESCKDCGNYSHTLDNTKCIKTPVLWLEITDPAGMSITIISVIGFIVIFAVSAFLYKLREMVAPNDPAPHIVPVACIVLIVTFVFGPLHVLEPTEILCHVRNGIFFMMLMMFSSILLVRSKFMTAYLQKHADKTFKGNLMAAQLVFLLLMFLLELGSIIGWIYIDKLVIEEFRPEKELKIWKQCEVSFTAARLVSTFIPCIILIIATFCGFRERNLEHSFYEPKFLSFTCVALCIIIVAFLPTFKYVVGIYKAIVMAFTMDVFAFTFMACLVLPKLYVGVMRSKRGIGEYPMKPGSAAKKSEKEKVKELRSQTSMQSSQNERTESSAFDGSTYSKAALDSPPISLVNGKARMARDVALDQREEEGIEAKEVSGYNNHTYDKSQDHDDVNDDCPPPYEGISKKTDL